MGDGRGLVRFPGQGQPPSSTSFSPLFFGADAAVSATSQVEPARRAYDALSAQAVITGRRRSQGGSRSSIPVLEVDETGLIKVNPLAAWSYAETWAYVQGENVPYNVLVDRGFKSIGDWHSTTIPAGVTIEGVGKGQPGAGADESERSGRWSGSSKTECGLHKVRSPSRSLDATPLQPD